MSAKTKDLAKRKFYAREEGKRLQLSALLQDLSLPQPLRQSSRAQLNALARKGCLARVRNRCVITGRGRGVHRFCRLSRIKIRELGAQGWIAGLRKSSW